MAKMKALWKGKYEPILGIVLVDDGDGGYVEKETEVGQRPVEYLDGVPARSLSEEEFEGLPEHLQKAVRASSLYDVRTEAEMSTGGNRAEPAPRVVEKKGS